MKLKGELQRKKKMRTEDSTYVWIVSSHDVSDDNRSIFKFQLGKKEQTRLENGGCVTSSLRSLTPTEAAAECLSLTFDDDS